MRIILKNIFADGYERVVEAKMLDGKKITVHFIENTEYLDSGAKSELKKIGDVIEGNFGIDLVSNSQKTSEKLMYLQNIPQSSNIKAVVEVFEVLDEYSLLAQTAIGEEKILIEFEDKVEYRKNDRVFIEGSLELYCNL